MSRLRPVLNVHPLANYSFGNSPPRTEGVTGSARAAKLAEAYAQSGVRRSVEGILLVNEHRHPHVLLLQTDGGFSLPGGKLKPGEEEAEGLKRKLRSKLAPAASAPIKFEVGECVATWWRPHVEAPLYPYVPPHVTRPREQRRVYVVHLPEKCFFAVPRNRKLLAVPLFELHQAAERYGAFLAALPATLARFHVNLLEPPPKELKPKE